MPLRDVLNGFCTSSGLGIRGIAKSKARSGGLKVSRGIRFGDVEAVYCFYSVQSAKVAWTLNFLGVPWLLFRQTWTGHDETWIVLNLMGHVTACKLQYFAIANATGSKQKSWPSMLVESWNYVETCWNYVSCFEPFKPFRNDSASPSKSLTVPPTGRKMPCSVNMNLIPWRPLWCGYLGDLQNCDPIDGLFCGLVKDGLLTKGPISFCVWYCIYRDQLLLSFESHQSWPNKKNQTGQQKRQVHSHFAQNEALSCDVSLPGAPFAKASPHLQQKMQHVKV